ncbi:MAG: hypothetical protein M1531_00325 [Chloroflexi bacterium]|nr:hypothetical protein [Chloroflexota bacterium]
MDWANWLPSVVVFFAGVVGWEIPRRLVASRMRFPPIILNCKSTGDEDGQRRWDIIVSLGDTPWWGPVVDAHVRGIVEQCMVDALFYNQIGTDWENSFDGRPFEFIWNEHIRSVMTPEHKAAARSIIVTRLRPQNIAIIAKRKDETVQTPRAFVIRPDFYRSGLSEIVGDGSTNLLLDDYVLVVRVRHAEDPAGNVHCFKLWNRLSSRLDALVMARLTRNAEKAFLKRAKPTFGS